MYFSAIFSIFIGVSMLIQWLISYFTDQIEEIRTEPIRITFHLAAELLTAVGLITSGIAIFAEMVWAKDLYLISLGMLFYTSIVSPGYFAQKGKWGWLFLFSLIILCGMYSLFLIS